MSKELFSQVLQCNRCNSDELNFKDTSFQKPLKPEGEIKCNLCNSKMHFCDGVLIADKNAWTPNQKRNAYVYSDFWERSDQIIKYDRITHEDELLDSWRKEFKGGVLLDAGCGSGRHLLHWTQSEVNADAFIMVDISDSIFQCRKYFEELNCSKPVIFIQCSIDKVPLKDKSISSTWSSGVIGLISSLEY